MICQKYFHSTIPYLIISFALIGNWAGHALAGERFAVAVSLANVRAGKGTSHDILWQATKFYPIIVTKKSGKWYRIIDYENDRGWIHSSLVRKIPSVITVRDDCNIRSGPSTKDRIVFKAGRGVPFKVLKRKGRWIKVRHADGDQGWIHKSLVW